MQRWELPLVVVLAGLCTTALSAQSNAPTAEQALGLKPMQAGVEYAQPSAEEVKQCVIKPEKIGKSTAWIVRDPQGLLLRRFSDSNGDNVVDQWSYFHHGLEVYRDIDADFNGKADQYRWLGSGGTKWGLDRNQDGKIDVWKVISPHEVTEEVVAALQTKNDAAFARLLPTTDEITALGLSKSAQEALQKRISEAPSKFRELSSTQQTISPQGKFIDFGAARPGTIPAGTDGSAKDVTVYENVSALIDQSGKPEQLYLGTLVRVDDGWRVLGAPQLEAGEDNPLTMMAAASAVQNSGSNAPQPSEKMQGLLEALQKLDQQMAAAAPADQPKLLEARIKTMRDLVNASPDQDHWVRELAEMLSSAAQIPGGEKRIGELADLEKQLANQKAPVDLISHVRYRRIWADFYASQRDPKGDFSKIQAKYVAELEEFVKAYPKSEITAEALLELGRIQEFGGETEAAQKWYEQLAKDFPNSPTAEKAAGAVRRLKSPGQTIALRGNALQGGTVDLTSYRGKVVLVHYWSTWCEPCKEDMAKIKELYARYGQRGFDVVGVNLDHSAATAQQYLSANRFPWKHISDEGGLDGRMANEMGVMTLPLMLLMDKQGKVVNRNANTADLEGELQQLLGSGQAANGGANRR